MIADCKMESIGTGATILVGIVEGVCTRGSVSVVVPSVGVTGILGERLVCTVVDSEMEGHGAVASIFIGGNESG